MSGLRILHVVHSLEPGGMENGVVNIASGLAAQGFETHVACLERIGAFAARLPVPGNTVILGKTKGFSAAATARLATHILRLRPHVVHTHNLGPLLYTALATVWGRTAPILHGEHSALTAAEREPRRFAQRRRFYGACAAVHTVADAPRDELVALGFSPAQITVVPNGVDTTRFAPGDRGAARARWSIPSDAQVVGIVGRFGAFKGHALLLDAFERIAGSQPHLHLLIAGKGGPLESEIVARVDAHPLRSRIHMAGFMEEPRVAFHAMDLLALPSTNEGMSNVALEAMACGIPVLANDRCGHEQILSSGTGILSDIRTAPALAAALTSALAEPARLVDFGVNARSRVAAEFSLTRMLARYADLYRAVAVHR
jgi:glycosyltransferase involved in cell wall biosynthesis